MEPKYAKVYEALLERISGMEPGERLDSEVKLASSFNVSPMTVRRALMLLSQNGLTVGVPGRGTFVAQPKDEGEESVVLTPTDGRWDSDGLPNTRVRLVSATLEPAGEAVQKALNANDEPLVAVIRRAHFLDRRAEQYVGIETVIVRADEFPGVLGLDLTGDISEIFEANYADKFASLAVKRTIRACLVGHEDAEELHISEPSALLIVGTSFQDSDGNKLIDVTTKYVAERVALTL